MIREAGMESGEMRARPQKLKNATENFGVTGALAVPSEELPTKRRWSTIKTMTGELSEQFKADWPTPCRQIACCGDVQTPSRWLEDMPDAFSKENF